MNCLSYALPDTIFALIKTGFSAFKVAGRCPPKSQVACQWPPCLPDATPAPFSSPQMRKTAAIPTVFRFVLPIKPLSPRGPFASHVAKTQHLQRKKNNASDVSTFRCLHSFPVGMLSVFNVRDFTLRYSSINSASSICRSTAAARSPLRSLLDPCQRSTFSTSGMTSKMSFFRFSIRCDVRSV